MDKLETAYEVQTKRLYYRPIGRSASRAARTRVSLSKKHLLQRLVYIESEPHERIKERRPNRLSQEVLLIHFIKHLVRIVLKRNSFYAVLGLSRLLHDYTTAETMEIYNFLVQDPDRMRDDTYYRMRKKQLMQEMKDRFGALVQTYKNNRREERFASQARVADYLQLARSCLARFSPWDMKCALPERFDPATHVISEFMFKGGDPDDEHVIEAKRLYAVLHPDCYRRLTSLLGLGLPDERIEIPFFLIPDSSPPQAGDPAVAPALDEEEIDYIEGLLADRGRRRKRSAGELLTVLVDGRERVRWNVQQVRCVQFEVEEGAEIIEVHGRDAKGKLTLVSHLLEYDQSGLKASHRTVKLAGGMKFSFAVPASGSSDAQTSAATVTISYEADRLIRSPLTALKQLGGRLLDRSLIRSWRFSEVVKSPLAIALLTCAVLFTIYLRTQREDPNPVGMSAPEEPTSPNNNNANSEVSQPLNQGWAAPGRPGVKSGAAKSPGQGKRITDSTRPRSLGDDETATPLKAIKQIYVHLSGPGAFSRQVRDRLLEAFRAGHRLNLVDEREQADALLECVVKPSRKGGGMITLGVELINERGAVIWPLGAKWQYTGEAAELVTRVVKDLLADIERSERRR